MISFKWRITIWGSSFIKIILKSLSKQDTFQGQGRGVAETRGASGLVEVPRILTGREGKR